MNTLHQLRCGGVLEAVRISCAGYPTKTPYPDFVDHFWNLAPHLLSTDMDDEGIAAAVLDTTGLKARLRVKPLSLGSGAGNLACVRTVARALPKPCLNDIGHMPSSLNIAHLTACYS